MADSPLSLWLELFERFGNEPFYATKIHGGLECFFCGLSSPSVTDQRHEPDCIWIRAKALCSRVATSERDVRATALLCIRQHGASATYYAAGRADDLLESGAATGAEVWRRVVAEIEKMQAAEPGESKH